MKCLSVKNGLENTGKLTNEEEMLKLLEKKRARLDRQNVDRQNRKASETGQQRMTRHNLNGKD